MKFKVKKLNSRQKEEEEEEEEEEDKERRSGTQHQSTYLLL